MSKEDLERKEAFEEGLKDLVEETGFTVSAQLQYNQDHLRAVLALQDIQTLREQAANQESQDDAESTDTEDSDDVVMAEGEE